MDSASGDVYVVDSGNTRVPRFGSPPDPTDLTVTLTTPPDGAVCARGQVVNAAHNCTDDADGSGVAACVATPPGAQERLDEASMAAKVSKSSTAATVRSMFAMVILGP